ncbi:MAG: beta-N-acetylglucosaminidase [Gemmatimonadetes bacterium]|nr:MAG: beta-N-acetylglucosaminidase [Gemmatimonadota bacterium]
MIPFIALVALLASAQDTALSIIPRPVQLTRRTGSFGVTAGTVIVTDRATRQIGYQLADWLNPATGYRLSVVASPGQAARTITLGLDTTLARLGEEGYRLSVTPTRITIRAYRPAGVFYGVETLRQLLPADIFRDAPVTGVTWSAPAVEIEDRPRFQWRGAHLDVSRSFMPKEFVKKYIDLLALHKLNRFHWHLTDDQGWRLEIRKYPRLTSVGAWRKQSLVGVQHRYADTTQWVYDNIPHGGFYTQADAREIVAYATARFITVVPEIEMPGHAQAAIAAYPWLGNMGQQLEVLTHWGVDANILNPSDSVIHFMQDVLTEVLAIFPSHWIHTGGDEAIKDQWKVSPVAQARIKELGLKDENALQSWMTAQMSQWLVSHGRALIGWDEILEGGTEGLAPNAVVMSWRGMEGGIAAAQAGHDVVMTPTSNTYFDYYQSQDAAHEPLAIGGFLPIDTVYAFEPVPASLDSAQAKRVLGTQGQIWTEYQRTPKNVEYMVFPRLIALAEVAWTPREQRNFADFSARLATHVVRLGILDVNYRPLARTVSGAAGGGAR